MFHLDNTPNKTHIDAQMGVSVFLAPWRRGCVTVNKVQTRKETGWAWGFLHSHSEDGPIKLDASYFKETSVNMNSKYFMALEYQFQSQRRYRSHTTASGCQHPLSKEKHTHPEACSTTRSGIPGGVPACCDTTISGSRIKISSWEISITKCKCS